MEKTQQSSDDTNCWTLYFFPKKQIERFQIHPVK